MTISKEQKKEIWKGVRQFWIVVWVTQLIFGGHAIYEMAAEFPSIGLIEYVILLTICAAIVATISVLALLVIAIVVGMIFYGINDLQRG